MSSLVPSVSLLRLVAGGASRPIPARPSRVAVGGAAVRSVSPSSFVR